MRSLRGNWAVAIGFTVTILFLMTVSQAAGVSCVDRTWTHGPYGYTETSNMGHWSGKHRNAVNFLFDCQCDENCRSTCLPRFGAKQCTDSGFIKNGMVHLVRESTEWQGGSTPNATGNKGQGCGIGYACFVKQCIQNEACPNFHIEASVNPLNIGYGIEFTTNANDIIFQSKPHFPFDCDACMTVESANGSVGEPENNPDIQDPESGDGGGGLPGGCRWRCVTRFYGQGGEGARVEDCSLIC